MKPNLSSSISSLQDLKALIYEIKKYAQWYAHSVIKMRVNNTPPEGQPPLSQTALDLLKSWSDGQPLTQQKIEQLVGELDKLVASSPQITITLAAMPSGELKRKIVAWCRNNIGPSILVDFRFNATILGGMVIKYRSQIFDWSFRRQILAKRELFPEVLRRV